MHWISEDISLDSLFYDESGSANRLSSCSSLRVQDDEFKAYLWAQVISGGNQLKLWDDEPRVFMSQSDGGGVKLHIAKVVAAIKSRWQAWTSVHSQLRSEISNGKALMDPSRARITLFAWDAEEERAGVLSWLFSIVAMYK
ncbi:hypothetical protein HDU67_005783, partial [Dinochytrium kinnereticum]